MENFLLSNVDSFILNTVYYTENKTNCVEIGLNQYDEYTPSIRLGAVQHSYSCISNDVIPEAVVLNEVDWLKFISLSTKINIFFSNVESSTTTTTTTTNNGTSSDSPMYTPILENKPNIFEADSEEIALGNNYFIEFDHEQKLLTFKYKVYPSVGIKCLDINFSFWNEILRLHTCISYKFKFIDNYKYYGRVIHSKIINYFIIQISKGRLTDNMLSFQTLRSMLISLKSEVLPKGPIECNFEHFNIHICHMIDAEIRAHSHSIIFKNVSNVLTNLQHYCTCNQCWWWWWN